MATWNRRREWDQRNLRRRRMVVFFDAEREHYSTCRTNCDEPLELICISDGSADYECAHGHVSHACNCAEIAAAFYEAAAEAMDGSHAGQVDPFPPFRSVRFDGGRQLGGDGTATGNQATGDAYRTQTSADNSVGLYSGGAGVGEGSAPLCEAPAIYEPTAAVETDIAAPVEEL